ncbi:MAG: hypothetical protein AAGF11_12705 [Myxococcota bacterium]
MSRQSLLEALVLLAGNLRQYLQARKRSRMYLRARRQRRRFRIRRHGANLRPPSTVWRPRFERTFARISASEGHGPPPVVVENRRVPNVGANAEVVVVNPEWMERVSDEICGGRMICQRDLVRGIAGHEWSHVTDARERSKRSDRSTKGHAAELRADRTAGRLLEQGGSSVAPLLYLLVWDASDATDSHPAGKERLEAVLAGQQEGKAALCGEGNDSCECHALSRPAHDDEPTTYERSEGPLSDRGGSRERGLKPTSRRGDDGGNRNHWSPLWLARCE